VGSRASLDTVEYRKISSLCRESNTDLTFRRYTDCALLKMQSVQKIHEYKIKVKLSL
jgi:hypothetical protein